MHRNHTFHSILLLLVIIFPAYAVAQSDESARDFVRAQTPKSDTLLFYGRQVCLETPGAQGAAFCEDLRRIFMVCREPEANTTVPSTWCMDLPEMNERCKSEKIKLIGNKFLLDPIECQVEDSLKKTKNRKPNPSIRSTNWVERMLGSMLNLADFNARRAVCAPDTTSLGQHLNRVCSPRVAVTALGTPGATPQPSCPKPPNSERAVAEILKNGVRRGATPEAFFVAAFEHALGGYITDAANLNKVAGCRSLCAVTPVGATVVEVRGYFSDQRDGPMISVVPNTWNHKPGHVMWGNDNGSGAVVPTVKDGRSGVCATFRNWYEGSVRDAQLVIYYKK